MCALSATIYLTLLGPKGLAELAEANAGAAAYTAEKLLEIPGAKKTFGGNFFNEFSVSLPCDAETLRKNMLAKHNIDIGLPLGRLFPDMPELKNALLVCATETKTAEDIDRLAAAVKEAL